VEPFRNREGKGLTPLARPHVGVPRRERTYAAFATARWCRHLTKSARVTPFRAKEGRDLHRLRGRSYETPYSKISAGGAFSKPSREETYAACATARGGPEEGRDLRRLRDCQRMSPSQTTASTTPFRAKKGMDVRRVRGRPYESSSSKIGGSGFLSNPRRDGTYAACATARGGPEEGVGLTQNARLPVSVAISQNRCERSPFVPRREGTSRLHGRP
jgi:hypothetical protein